MYIRKYSAEKCDSCRMIAPRKRLIYDISCDISCDTMYDDDRYLVQHKYIYAGYQIVLIEQQHDSGKQRT